MTFFSVPAYAVVFDGDNVRCAVLWPLRYEADTDDDDDDALEAVEVFRGIAPRQPLFEQLQLLLWWVRPREQTPAEEAVEAIEEQEAADADLMEADDDDGWLLPALLPLIDETEDMAEALEQLETPAKEVGPLDGQLLCYGWVHILRSEIVPVLPDIRLAEPLLIEYRLVDWSML